MKSAQQVLTYLINEKKITPEYLADKFRVKTITIDRWLTGQTEPSHIELKYLNRIYVQNKKS